ncbi:MAG: glucuronyl esterase domain-containing protein [Brachybacterium sp.]|uniref:glucuronyl esterase domain-containing protein n=1 Tax=Brachybacterium sp. AOP42-E1-35 TaxID=3457664 RepID=UPI003FBA2C21
MPTFDRGELVSIFVGAVYGEGPAQPVSLRVETHSDTLDLESAARVRNLQIELSSPLGVHPLLLSVITPATTEAVPLMVGLNFRGNHTVSTDPSIALPSAVSGPLHYDLFTEDPQPRGAYASRWQVPMLIERGYGLATACYLQLGPDSPALRTTGAFPLLQGSAPGSWGGIGLWAWVMQRVLDVLLQESLGTEHIAFGHSRLGKTALWAAVQDERFAGVIANNSGCMGASMSTAADAETPALLAEVRPYWFAEGFPRHVEEGPTWPDADVLLSAIAPRPVYVASATEDAPADPAGERAAVQRARALAPEGTFGHHLREGPHDVTATDWERFLTFFDHALGTTPREHRTPGTGGSSMH